MKEEQLIFVVSQPRAGSTMLQALLSNNDRVNTTSEHWFMLNQMWYLKPKLIKGEFNAWAATDALKSISEVVNPEVMKEEVKSFCLSFYRHILTMPGNFCIDKTPRYYEIIPELMELFPNAKFILLIRNPMDVLCSIMDTWKLYTFTALYEMRRDILLAPNKLANALKIAEGKPNVQIVKYEQLISDPGKTMRELYHWLNIPFTNEQLDYSDNIKHLGKYGDPTGVKGQKQPGVGKKWNESKTGVRFREFFEGYAYFIKDSLIKLGYEQEASAVAPKRVFGAFKYYCDSKWPERKALNLNTELKKEMMLKGMFRKFLN